MSSLGSPNPLLFGAAKDYEIEKSLRFNPGDSTYLTRSVSGAGTLNTMTFSFWVKRAASDAGAIYSSGVVDARGHIYFSSDQLYIQPYNNPSANKYVYTAAVFRDFSAWYHVVIRLNGMTLSNIGTAITVWVNGVETSTTVASAGSPSEDPRFNDAQVKDIGRFRPSGGYFSGYLAEFHFVDGTALDHTSFGKTNTDTGQWVPIEVSGVTYGTNGFYLPFTDNSGTTATTLGKDSAGSNNYTPNNFSVAAGAGNDSVVDTPTNNYCVLNGVEVNGTESAGTLTQGGLEFTADNNYAVCPGTFSLKNGKYYWEVTYQAGTQIYGIYRGNAMGENAYVSYDPNGNCPGLGIQANNGTTYGSTGDGSTAGGSQGTSINSLTTNDVMAFASDIPNGTLKVYKNDTLEHTFTGFNSHDWFPAVSGYAGQVCQVNFGSNGFKYTPPTGYVALCTANLSEPTIIKSTDFFNVNLWSGNAGTQSITMDFQPDMVWNKCRTDTHDHQRWDALRGVTKSLRQDMEVEATHTDGLTAFNSNGFTLGANSRNNGSGETYVGWSWKESATAGFDMVKDEGTGSDHTIAHSLGVKPDMMIRKGIDRQDHWQVYHKDLDGADATEYLEFDDDSVQQNYHEIWNDTPPTSSVFTVGSDTSVNEDGKNYITYLFSSIEGFSKVGRYTGNGGTDGIFLYLGFKPAFLLMKRINTSEDWIPVDNKRDPDNPVANYMRMNTNAIAADGVAYDFLSNGVKFRGSSQNENNEAYIYLAFAEEPFKYANAR